MVTDIVCRVTIHTFLQDYRDLFSRKLNAIPADLPPLKIEVDCKKFMTKQSQGPPRMMTVEKEQHIRKFIAEGLESDIIRASNAAHYSQVHLVAKPMNESPRGIIQKGPSPSAGTPSVLAKK